MVGTVIDYSGINDCFPYIKVVAGEKFYTIYPNEFPTDIRMNDDIEFYPGSNKYNHLGVVTLNDYILIDCGLIHQYAIRKQHKKFIENVTLYDIRIIKDLSSYDMELINNKIIFSNGSDRVVFKKVETSGELQWMLDEFI
ncbi:hypothetical protein [Clostridium hydrogenum]|uniref:hypothetical protein n=1 Tax=Clostridium hydrogenum TaxID=2855764 RepID=UPI001F32E93D|nr:hypothetical protein [Clostridium hydrogenum]